LCLKIKKDIIKKLNIRRGLMRDEKERGFKNIVIIVYNSYVFNVHNLELFRVF